MKYKSHESSEGKFGETNAFFRVEFLFFNRKMLDYYQKELRELDNLNQFMGTPSAQKIFQLLVCWETLPINEIITKTRISESQTYSTLKNLEKIELVIKKSRGIYTLTQNKFVVMLKDAYVAKLEQFIGKQLYHISKNLDKWTIDEIKDIWAPLLEQWAPLLNKNHAQKVSSIAGHIYDKIMQEKGN
jgi:predicted transcriptional regulator